jgi:hypothetical protein
MAHHLLESWIMFESWLSSASSLFKSALLVLAGNPTAETIPPIPAATGLIHEIEAGDGPGWGTLSGLTAHPSDPTLLYAVTDQDSAPVRIVEIALAAGSAKVIRQIGVNGGGFASLDPEAIVAKPDGGFWLASEGKTGNVPPNVLLEIDARGAQIRTIQLPGAIAQRMPKKGFEGVALEPVELGGRLVVAFQAPIEGDPPDFTRIGAVDPASGLWSFYLYPLDRTTSGELTGLSELLHLGGRKFAAIERDSKGGKKSIKWVTTFDLGSTMGAAPEDTPPKLVKRRAIDLVPLFTGSGRKVEKEVEGLALAADGQVYAVTDNDNERPTLLLRLGKAQEIL